MTFKRALQRLFMRYTLSLLGMSIILFMVFTALNYYWFVVKANEECNQEVSSLLAAHYASLQQSLASLAQRPEISGLLAGTDNGREAYQLLYALSRNQAIKANFIVLDRDCNIVATNLYTSNQALFKANWPMQTRLHQLLSDTTSDASQASVIKTSYAFGQQAGFMLVQPLYSPNGPIVGCIVLEMQDASIKQLLGRRTNSTLVVTDRFDNVMLTTDESLIDNLGKLRLNQAANRALNDDYHIVRRQVIGTELQLITMLSTVNHQQASQLGGLLFALVGTFLLILAQSVATKATLEYRQAIDELLIAIGQCRRGNLNYQLNAPRFSELQAVYQAFQQAMLKLQALLEHNTELAERKRQMEVKHLEGQFNPHFIFNVMEALRFEILKNPQQAANMIVAFAHLMRYSINYGSSHVSLKTDIRYVQDYLALQKMRFNTRLTYRIEIEPALLECMFPKLLLQPIVENSIVHGLETGCCLEILIKGSLVDDVAVICVEDNGPGMQLSELDKLRSLLAADDAQPEHIGLYNVHRAAQLLYGQNYGLTLASIYGQGMSVTLTIPVKAEEQDVQGTNC